MKFDTAKSLESKLVWDDAAISDVLNYIVNDLQMISSDELDDIIHSSNSVTFI